MKINKMRKLKLDLWQRVKSSTFVKKVNKSVVDTEGSY